MQKKKSFLTVLMLFGMTSLYQEDASAVDKCSEYKKCFDNCMNGKGCGKENKTSSEEMCTTASQQCTQGCATYWKLVPADCQLGMSE